MRGTKANLIVRQGAEQQYQPTLYIESTSHQEASLRNCFDGAIEESAEQISGY